MTLFVLLYSAQDSPQELFRNVGAITAEEQSSKGLLRQASFVASMSWWLTARDLDVRRSDADQLLHACMPTRANDSVMLREDFIEYI